MDVLRIDDEVVSTPMERINSILVRCKAATIHSCGYLLSLSWDS